MTKGSFTGRSRERKTRRGILLADRFAQFLISVGGIGTIVAVLGVMVFLVWVVVPLFLPTKVDNLTSFERGAADDVVHVAVDEYQLMAWILRRDGEIELFRLDNGERLDTRHLFDPGQLVSSSFLIRGDLAAFGLANGTVQLAEIGFDTRIVDADEVPTAVVEALAAEPAAAVTLDGGMVELTPTGQYRWQRLVVEMGENTQVANGPVHRVAHVVRSSGPLVVAVAEQFGADAATVAEDAVGDDATGEEQDAAGEDEAQALVAANADAEEAAEEVVEHVPGTGTLRLVSISGEETSNFLTGGTTLEFSAPEDLPFAEAAQPGVPDYVAVNGSGSDVFVAWKDGGAMRIRRAAEPFVAEQGSLIDEGRTLESMAYVLGNTTLIWGDSSGVIRGGFTVPREGFEGQGLFDPSFDEESKDVFAFTKSLATQGDAPATALASSARSRLMWAGFGDGDVRIYNVTNASELGSVQLPATSAGASEPVLHLTMAPKEDGLLAITASRIFRSDIDPRHPEASWAGLFRPVWYEGYGQEQHTWQSSSATDDFEMKLGLWPLIFGTLKATFYSMIFGAPLALLAAVYTSEFLHPRVKGVIKPGIELMASLPSVVLGFLAALVIAPYIEQVVPATLMIFVAAPVAFLIGAYLWQLLPVQYAVRYGNWRFAFMALALPVGFLGAAALGPVVENLLFGGDIRGWLSWEPGRSQAERYANSTGGWLILFLPLSSVVVAFLLDRITGPWMRDRSTQWDRRQYALADLGKFVGAVVATLTLAFAIAALLEGLGFDPRGGLIDTYVQRNALIVGFVMGFAVIPIIYTISEDALQAVPEHLRSASLGAGATQWQTATRIIIPTAMSGLFSALMVGLGRAVGETMIVLMAAGNTPVLEWNIFNGFRTLSANIAVELPEAVRDSTHYRTLFLAALVLFIMTFVVNTIAEIIRLRFRKRAYQL